MRYALQIKNTERALKVKGQGRMFQPLLAFTMGHIPTKLHQFLISSFRNFVRTVTLTRRQTHRRYQKQCLLAADLAVYD